MPQFFFALTVAATVEAVRLYALYVLPSKYLEHHDTVTPKR